MENILGALILRGGHLFQIKGNRPYTILEQIFQKVLWRKVEYKLQNHSERPKYFQPCFTLNGEEKNYFKSTK